MAEQNNRGVGRRLKGPDSASARVALSVIRDRAASGAWEVTSREAAEIAGLPIRTFQWAVGVLAEAGLVHAEPVLGWRTIFSLAPSNPAPPAEDSAPAASRPALTHAELVDRAARWLRGTMKCGVVFAERSCGGSHEIPDAIGWRVGFWSTLVECKTSRADFFRDSDKPFRVDPSLGMGQARYYMTPAGLLRREEIPGDWGLVEVHGDRVKVVVEAPKAPLRESACRWELAMLVAAMRRVQLGCEPTEKVAAGDGVAGE